MRGKFYVLFCSASIKGNRKALFLEGCRNCWHCCIKHTQIGLMENSVDNFRLQIIVYQKPGLLFKESKNCSGYNSRGIYHLPLKFYI